MPEPRLGLVLGPRDWRVLSAPSVRLPFRAELRTRVRVRMRFSLGLVFREALNVQIGLGFHSDYF